jgi:Sulfotransferase family
VTTSAVANPQSRFGFILGLHKSGTSLVHDLLRRQSQASSLVDTGLPQDEGQHLQAVLPTATDMGGPGRFANSPDAHLRAAATATYPRAAARICQDWAPFWQGGADCFLEKSPSDLLRSGFLKACFPNSRFILLIRHPMAVSYATAVWTHQPLPILLRHWARGCTTAVDDLARLGPDGLVVRYEDFVGDPAASLATMQSFLGLPVDVPDTSTVVAGGNDRYLERWARRRDRLRGLTVVQLRALAKTCETLGYDLF